MSLATVAAVVGIGAGAKSLIGGSQGGSRNSNTYIPTGLGQADTTWQTLLGQLAGGATGASNEITPQVAQAFAHMLGIDTSGLTGAGAAAGQQYGQVGQQAQGAASDMLGQGRSLGQAGQQLWQTALDPQNDLRNKIQQQVTDASRAGTSARGIGMGGEAAGIENKDVSDFLLNWNNNQLQRQATGLQGYANAANQSGRQYAGGLTAGQMGADATLQSGAVPCQANVAAASLPFNAANLYTGSLGGVNQQLGGVMNSIIPYLNSGQGVTQQGFFQGQVGMNNLTTGLNQLGKTNWGGIFGNTPTPYGTSDPYGNGYYGSSSGYGDPYAQGGYGT